MAKAGLWAVTDAEERKRGERTGLDTLVVHAVNVGHSRLKLKGIDGGPHKRRSMRINSMQREEPYQGLTCILGPQRWGCIWLGVCRWCMVVVSSCREMFG